MAIKDELLDELMEGLEKPEDLIGDKGLLQELKKALIEKALGAELTHHLGYERGDPSGRGSGNSRNGNSKKRVKDRDGQEVSPDLISRITSAVMEEVREWQARPLDPVYPIVIFDALRIKIRDKG